MKSIDPRTQIAELGEPALIAAAEDYFASIADPGYHFRKPLTSFAEAPVLLHHSAALLAVLNAYDGVRVLDVGAGSCWLSRMLAQLGAHVIALDVSPSALALGEALMERLPLIEPAGSITFSSFDGRHLEMPDRTVDRIVVHDAWHHIVSQEQMLAECARVLRPNGSLVISDVGPAHSRTAQSQFEMRNFRVIEQDTDADSVRDQATRAGFARITSFYSAPAPIPVAEGSLEDALGNPELAQRLWASARASHGDYRLLRCDMSETHVTDSRQAHGLKATIHATFDPGTRRLDVHVTNAGSSRWLTDAGTGQVNVGIHLMRDDVLADLDFARIALDGPVEPGESRSVSLAIGEIRGDLVIDLVSEQVGWFENFGGVPAFVRVG